MIIDSVDRLSFYRSLNPLIDHVVAFIKANDLGALELGRHEILGDKVYVNICSPEAKNRQEAVMECHRKMIDVHVPISADEQQGFLSCSKLSTQPYDENGDCSIHPDRPSTYYTLRIGEMAIHFPGEGHSPAITANGLKKAIFKIMA